MSKLQVLEFEPELFIGNVDVVYDLEKLFAKQVVGQKNKDTGYLIVKRPLLKRVAIKRVSLTSESIIEQYIKEIEIFHSYRTDTSINRVILFFIKEAVNTEDLLELKECIVFDKIKREFMESIEIILLDRESNKAYFDGLKINSTLFKYKDTRKILLNELGFFEDS